MLLVLGACGGSSSESDRGTSAGDGRYALLAELGSPDSFVIEADVGDGGEIARRESWSYYDAESQIDLLDGVILWHLEIDPLAKGSLLPFLHDPTEFEIGMTLSDIEELPDPLFILAMASGDDLGRPGVDIYGGEQMLLGFADGQLVYVETFPLTPGEAKA